MKAGSVFRVELQTRSLGLWSCQRMFLGVCLLECGVLLSLIGEGTFPAPCGPLCRGSLDKVPSLNENVLALSLACMRAGISGRPHDCSALEAGQPLWPALHRQGGRRPSGRWLHVWPAGAFFYCK